MTEPLCQLERIEQLEKLVERHEEHIDWLMAVVERLEYGE